MPTTQSAYDWLRSRAVAEAARRDLAAEPGTEPAIDRARERAPERYGRAEVERLQAEIEGLVGSVPDGVNARAAVDSALCSVARLQVVTANLDASNPPKGTLLARALVELADKRLHGHADAIERGMAYTADNTVRHLRNE